MLNAKLRTLIGFALFALGCLIGAPTITLLAQGELHVMGIVLAVGLWGAAASILPPQA